jgi:hypothetical protein
MERSDNFTLSRRRGVMPIKEFATLSLAMRAAARGTWSTIKTSIEGIESQVQSMKEAYEAEVAHAKP